MLFLCVCAVLPPVTEMLGQLQSVSAALFLHHKHMKRIGFYIIALEKKRKKCTISLLTVAENASVIYYT